jgi:hypothetical protein
VGHRTVHWPRVRSRRNCSAPSLSFLFNRVLERERKTRVLPGSGGYTCPAFTTDSTTASGSGASKCSHSGTRAGEAVRACSIGAVTVPHPPVRTGEDIFALDRLIDAAANRCITVRMSATRPYGRGSVTGAG